MKLVNQVFAAKYLRTTIRAARTLNVGCGAAAIRNHGSENTGRIEEIADFAGHDAGNECFVEGKGGQAGKGSNFGGNGTSEIVRVKLQEFHGTKYANIVDTTRQLVVIHVCIVIKARRIRKRKRRTVRKDDKTYPIASNP